MANIFIYNSEAYTSIEKDFLLNLEKFFSKESNHISTSFKTKNLATDLEFDLQLRNNDIIIVYISYDSLNISSFINRLRKISIVGEKTNQKLIVPIYQNTPAYEVTKDIFKTNKGYIFDNYIPPIEIAKEIENDIIKFQGEIIARQSIEEKVVMKIEKSYNEYVETTITELNTLEESLKKSAQNWYLTGFLAIGLSIIITIISLGLLINNTLNINNYTVYIIVSVKIVVLISLVLTGSKYSHSLAKSYMTEALKVSDRIHAIKFGKVYLQIVDKQLDPKELKDIFKDWNIGNSTNSFSNLHSNEINIEIVDKVIDLVKNIKK